MHIHHAETISWPSIKFGTWRLWDSYVTWSKLEPTKDNWDFKLLDKYVAMAKLTNVEVILPLAMTPEWASSNPNNRSSYGRGASFFPTDIGNWRNFVHTVGLRYKGKIKYYEIWNEPNDKTFSNKNDVNKIVELTRVAYEELKKIDSTIKIVSPAATGGGEHVKWLDDFLTQGGSAYVDIIAYHFYVPYLPDSKPEAMLDIIQAVRKVMIKNGVNDKPLWNTETGWLIANEDGGPDSSGYKYWKKLDRSNAGPFIARAYILSWASGVERLYWYSWDHKLMGFVEPNTKLEKRYVVQAYAKTMEWLIGNVVTSCNKTLLIWTCSVNKPSGENEWLVWSEAEKLGTWNIPLSWQIKEVESLDGTIYNLSNNHLLISQSPVLLRTKP
jgi:hypothetical protein